jgi:hypothetical protein
MRWFRVPPVAAAVLVLGLASAGPVAAQPDHLHLDLALVGCGTMQATGYELPAGARLDLRFVNAANDATLLAETPTTDADGALELTAKVPLTGVRTVRLEAARPGADKPFAFSEMTIPGNCPLPFTGRARSPSIAGLALGLLLAGALLVGVSAYRGRHRAGRLPS